MAAWRRLTPSPPRMTGRCRLALLFMAMMLVTFTLPHCQRKTDAPSTLPVQRVRIAGQTFHLELAVDDEARYQGLSDRPSIDHDGGMLFVFPRERHLGFVMRRCLVPIDLIYVGAGGRIVSMHPMEVVPYDTPEGKLHIYHSGWPAQFAIELRQGSIDRLSLKVGQRLDLPWDRLKALAR